MQEKAPTSMHSVRLEPTKSILIGTRTTYQATGDAGIDRWHARVSGTLRYIRLIIIGELFFQNFQKVGNNW